MTEQEIKLRCLELAYNLGNNSESLILTTANNLYNFVISTK